MTMIRLTTCLPLLLCACVAAADPEPAEPVPGPADKTDITKVAVIFGFADALAEGYVGLTEATESFEHAIAQARSREVPDDRKPAFGALMCLVAETAEDNRRRLSDDLRILRAGILHFEAGDTDAGSLQKIEAEGQALLDRLLLSEEGADSQAQRFGPACGNDDADALRPKPPQA